MISNIIQIVVEKLTKYPNIKFDQLDDKSIEIHNDDLNGFSILLNEETNGNTIYLKTFHSHFGKNEIENEELLDLLYFALSGVARIKEFSKKDKIYKSILELQGENGKWEEYGATIFFDSKFWIKPDINYFQNNLIQKM